MLWPFTEDGHVISGQAHYFRFGHNLVYAFLWSGDRKAGVDLQKMPASCDGLQRMRTKMVVQDNSRWTGECLAMRLALTAEIQFDKHGGSFIKDKEEGV